ncbi:hypothetical protein EDC04DRAFT_2650029 [Pisolithus marmoratus]|nr:hypothetical protein EDC04DRAFT_2650029 [Pisolithus marmoratus]
MLLLTESTLFWLNLTWNAISAQEHPNNRDELCTTFISSNPGLEVCTTLSSRISHSQHLQSEKDIGANLLYGCRRIRGPTSLPCQSCRS